MDRAKLADEFHEQGFNCAQSVFLSFCDELGMPQKMGARLTCALGSGFAGTGGICGAVSGACLAVSLKHGRDEGPREGEPWERQLKTYELVQQLQADFAAEFGAVDCPALLQKGLEHSGGENEKVLCPRYVMRAAQLADQAVSR